MLTLGIGDDTAAWRGNQKLQLATADTLVEGTHFNLATANWRNLGFKSLAINLSDIAAMGGVPQYALVAMALPATLTTDNIIEFYEGMDSLADQFKVTIAGGNMAFSQLSVITVTVTGYSNHDIPLLRSAAKPGDEIAITGYPGLSSAGLYTLNNQMTLPPDAATLLIDKHSKPVPRIVEGQMLRRHGINTAIDISDGLISDLYHICEASKVSAAIYANSIPVHSILTTYFPEYMTMVLHGGEDYELLFTGRHEQIEELKRILDCPITVIGNIVEESLPNRVTIIENDGTAKPADQSGWDHFRKG